MVKPERIGEIIARERFGNPRGRRLKLELIRNNWRSLVGEKTSEHSYPSKLSRGTLTVAAEGAAWAAEMSMESGDLVGAISRMLGKETVKKIRVQSRPEVFEGGEGNDNGGAEGSGKKEVRLEEKITEEIGRVGDEEVRRALIRMAKASKASRQNKQSGD